MTVVEPAGGPRNGDRGQPPLGSSRWADLAGKAHGPAAVHVDTTAQAADLAEEPEPAPLLEVCVDLAPGMRTRMDRCAGDVPVLEVVTGRARLVVSFDVGDPTMLGLEHVALAEAFAEAASEVRNELQEIVAVHTAAEG